MLGELEAELAGTCDIFLHSALVKRVPDLWSRRKLKFQCSLLMKNDQKKGFILYLYSPDHTHRSLYLFL